MGAPKLGPLSCSDCGETTNRPRKNLCVPCYNQRYYLANREKLLSRAKRWPIDNPEQYLATRRAISKRKYHAFSSGEKLERSRQRTAKMSEKEKEYRRKNARDYYQKHKHEKRLKRTRRKAKHRRRAKKQNVARDLTYEQREVILVTYDSRCVYCGERSDDLTQDHIVPVKHNGEYTIHNIIPACLRCNQIKHAGPPLIDIQPLLF